MDNQLFGAMVPTMLYMSPGRKDSPMTPELPMTTKHSPTNAALRINLRKTNISHSWNADIYENLIVKIRKFVLQIEEKLLWKLFEFAGYNERNLELEQLDENSFKSQRWEHWAPGRRERCQQPLLCGISCRKHKTVVAISIIFTKMIYLHHQLPKL